MQMQDLDHGIFRLISYRILKSKQKASFKFGQSSLFWDVELNLWKTPHKVKDFSQDLEPWNIAMASRSFAMHLWLTNTEF